MNKKLSNSVFQRQGKNCICTNRFRLSSTITSWNGSSGNKWWYDRDKWGADTSVSPSNTRVNLLFLKIFQPDF